MTHHTPAASKQYKWRVVARFMGGLGAERTSKSTILISAASAVNQSSRRWLYAKTVGFLHGRREVFFHGDKSRAEIALTFDDGPSVEATPAILDILKHHRVHATFFCLGKHVAAYPQLLRRVHEDGHVIGNHTWTHPDLKTVSLSVIRGELHRTSEAIRGCTGSLPTLFRSPYGSLSLRALRVARRAGMATAMWNADVRDWAAPDPQAIAEQTLALASNGAILLLHDNTVTGPRTALALGGIIERLRERGFDFVTIPQMLANDQSKP